MTWKKSGVTLLINFFCLANSSQAMTPIMPDIQSAACLQEEALEQKKDYFTDLPKELQLKIIASLPLGAFIKIGQTCRSLQEMTWVRGIFQLRLRTLSESHFMKLFGQKDAQNQNSVQGFYSEIQGLDLSRSHFDPRLLDRLPLKFIRTLKLGGIFITEKNRFFKNVGYYDLGPIFFASLEKLNMFENLESLDLSNNDLQDRMLDPVSTLSKLSTLDLSHNRIKKEGAKHLGKLTSLHTLSLSSNFIGSEGAVEIAKLTGLRFLSVSENYIGSKGAVEIGKLTDLQSLDVSMNDIGNFGAKHIIGKLSSLEKLNMGNNDIGFLGTMEIGKLTSLCTLSVSGNRLGFKGAVEIGKLTRLHTLHVDKNGIGVAGAGQIAKLTGLRTLRVDLNGLGFKGAVEIGKLTGLHTLSVCGNFIGTEGAVEIGKLTSLRILLLTPIGLQNEEVEQIRTLNPRVKVVEIEETFTPCFSAAPH